jgi:hypothetical protein
MMARLLVGASVLALAIGFAMPIAHAQWYDDGGGVRRHSDDEDWRPSRRHYDDDDYYRRPPRRHSSDYDEDYHRHAPVIIIHPPSWMQPGRPSYTDNNTGDWRGPTNTRPRRPVQQPDWTSDERPQRPRHPTQQEDWDAHGSYGGGTPEHPTPQAGSRGGGTDGGEDNRPEWLKKAEPRR